MTLSRKLIGWAICAWFVFLFVYFGFAASQSPWMKQQLGPTVIGLGVLVMLIFAPTLMKLIRAIAGQKGKADIKAAKAKIEEPVLDFDADAVIEKYMANRKAEESEEAQPAATFGRRTRPTFGRRTN